MKKLLVIMFICMAQPVFPAWSDYGLTHVSSGKSSLENAEKHLLRDSKGRNFHIHTSAEPDRASMEKIIKYKDDILSWKHVKASDLSFYIYNNRIHAVLLVSQVSYSGTNLRPYLPSGFTFIEGKKGLNYQYRIIVRGTSLKLDSAYSGEDRLLGEMLAYVKGIRSGKIIVEDEKVVSGSVVSFLDEKKMGKMQVHPVGDLPPDTKAAMGIREPWNIRTYISAQCTYLLPVRFLGDIFIGGYGGSVSVGIIDLGFSIRKRTIFNFDLELTSGYWHLDKREQNSSATGCSIQNACVIPVGLSARYRINLNRNIYITPSLNFGFHYNRLYYNKFLADGSCEKVRAREWNPAVMPGFRFEYRFEKLFIFTGADFMAMIERRKDITTFLFNAGAGYMF